MRTKKDILKTFNSQKQLPSFKPGGIKCKDGFYKNSDGDCVPIKQLEEVTVYGDPVERKYAEWLNSMRDQYETGAYPNIIYNYLTGDIDNDNVEWRNYGRSEKSPYTTWAEFERAAAKRMKKENEGQQEQQRQEIIENSPTVTAAPEKRSLLGKGFAIATHPLTAFGYSVRNQPMPDYFEKGSVNPVDRALQVTAALAGLRGVSPYLNSPAVIGSKTIPWLTGNNLLWGTGAYVSGNQIINPNSEVRTSINEAIQNPTFDNVAGAIGNTGLTVLGFTGLPLRSGLLSLGDDFTRAGQYLTTKDFLKNAPNISITKPLKDAFVTTALSKQLSFGKPRVAYRPIVLPRKIDPITRSTVNIQNDFVNAGVEKPFETMTNQDYNDFTNFLYRNNQSSYDMPLIEFKSSRPISFLENIGAGTTNSEGLLFKERFCPPGSECAKSANSFTNRVYTDITGKPFEVAENAHNAWHMEDQMTRHGGVNITGTSPMKIGDRVLMGNNVNQSTYFPGYTADARVRHAGVYAGNMRTDDGKIIPMVFESGRNNPAYINPMFHTFTGPGSIIEAIRPRQFLDESFGAALADKNIRYAFRDKPSVAIYSSENKNVQSIFNKAEDYREKIKRTYDLTNDEFDEILNSLIGIGAQETKLNASLPGSFLPKAKIQLQNTLLQAGLTKPIKSIINTTKGVGNKILSTNSSLPDYPGASFIEMESAKLAEKEGIPLNDAITIVKSQYRAKPRFTLSTIEPSKGMFRQKFQTEEGKISGFGNISKDEISNGLSQMAQNYSKVKQTYPDATPRQLMDITTLMWNSPGKAMNQELIDFYIFGKNNPDPARFNFDYVNKINQFKNKYINIKPIKVEPYLDIFRNKTYPEIQYRTGGKINYLRGNKK